MSGARNVRGGLVLLSVGLGAGLVMSLYAFQPLVPVPAALAHYDDLPRRLIRLAHIAAIMLPLINIVLGPWLDRLNLTTPVRETASWLLLAGGATLPAALALEAAVPTLGSLHIAGLPAIAFCLGVFLVSAGAYQTDFAKQGEPQDVAGLGPRRPRRAVAKEVSHGDSDRRGAEDAGDHHRVLQKAPRRA